MACTATQAEYNQMAEGILQKRYTPLGAGTFGAVFHIGDYIVKRIILINKYEVADFEHEVTIWKHLAAIPAMRPYMPQFCRALLIENAPPPPEIQDYAALPFMEQYPTWYQERQEWERLYKDEHFAYGFIFQVFEPVRELHDIFQGALKIPFSADMGYKLFTDITNGFSILHQAGIVHRDIKADNILIRQNGSPIIIDFGMACKLFDEHGKLQACAIPYHGIKNYTPQNYQAVGKRKHLPRIFTNELQSVKRGWLTTTKKPVKVAVKGVADPISNPASDMYTLSITVLRPLVAVTDWSGNRRYERWAKKTIQEYERAIVPFLAANIGRKRMEGMNANKNNNNNNSTASSKSGSTRRSGSSRRRSSSKKASRS
jgi:serine/threonine protein kinase